MIPILRPSISLWSELIKKSTTLLATGVCRGPSPSYRRSHLIRSRTCLAWGSPVPLDPPGRKAWQVDEKKRKVPEDSQASSFTEDVGTQYFICPRSHNCHHHQHHQSSFSSCHNKRMQPLQPSNPWACDIHEGFDCIQELHVISTKKMIFWDFSLLVKLPN